MARRLDSLWKRVEMLEQDRAVSMNDIIMNSIDQTQTAAALSKLEMDTLRLYEAKQAYLQEYRRVRRPLWDKLFSRV